ncbi:hypothetical protein HMPREF9141_1412, partial [Prevotella multiformis DSM 16608]
PGLEQSLSRNAFTEISSSKSTSFKKQKGETAKWRKPESLP